MTLGQSISTCFRKYAVFKGCASRSEYWWWTLFSLVAITAALILGFVIAEAYDMRGVIELVLTVYTPPMLVYLLLLLPTMAVTVRRMHDAGRSGWWAILPLLCGFIGGLLILPFTLAPSRLDLQQPPTFN